MDSIGSSSKEFGHLISLPMGMGMSANKSTNAINYCFELKNLKKMVLSYIIITGSKPSQPYVNLQ